MDQQHHFRNILEKLSENGQQQAASQTPFICLGKLYTHILHPDNVDSLGPAFHLALQIDIGTLCNVTSQKKSTLPTYLDVE